MRSVDTAGNGMIICKPDLLVPAVLLGRRELFLEDTRRIVSDHGRENSHAEKALFRWSSGVGDGRVDL